MKVRLRRVLYWSGAVFAALIVACYALLAAMTFDDLVALLRDEIKTATGRDLKVAGSVDLQISLSPSIDMRDVRFANAPWGSRADMVTLDRLQVEVELLPLLFGNIVVNRLVLNSPDILLETDSRGRGNWEFETADGVQRRQVAEDQVEADGISLPDVQTFAVRGGRLTIQGAEPGEPLRVTLTEASGRVPEGAGSRSLVLRGRYNDSPFRVEGTFGNLRDILSGAASPLDLTLEAGGAKVSLQGTAGNLVGAAAASLRVVAEGDSLAGLSPFVGSDLPDLGPFELSAGLEITPQSLEASGLALRLGNSDLAGAGALALDRERPFLSGDLVAKRLSLADFLAVGEPPRPAEGGEAETNAARTANGDGGRLFSAEPLALESLSALDARLSLRAGELWLSQRLVIAAAALSAQLEAGRLTLNSVSGQLAGGTLAGRFAVDAGERPATVAVAAKGENMDLGRLLRDVEVSDEVMGELALDLDLSSRGQSLHEWASRLYGHAQAISLDGTMDNTLLAIFSAGVSDITGPLFGSRDFAKVNCIVGHFDIAGGEAKSRALVLDTGTFAVSGRGAVDLGAEQLNLAFDTETSEPSLASLAIPFLVVGPIDDPDVVPDPVGAAGNVVGTVGTVAEAGGNLAAKMVNTLSGLVGSGPLVIQIGSDQTLCDEALVAIGQSEVLEPAAAAKGQSPSEQSATEHLVDDAEGATEDVRRKIDKGLKRLFGN